MRKMKRAKKYTAPLGLNLEREVELAEVLLASRDMMHVLELLNRVPWDDENDFAALQASVEIVVAYCRPFTTTIRRRESGPVARVIAWLRRLLRIQRKRRVVGRAWTRSFTDQENKLHKEALDIRNRDHAHTDAYDGRVSLHLEKLDPGERIPRYSVRTSTRGFTRAQLRALAQMVSKVREAIDLEKKRLGDLVLMDRMKAGYTRTIELGVVDRADAG